MSPPFLVTAGPTLGIAGVVPAFALGVAASATFTAFGFVGAARLSVTAETLPAEWAFVDNGDGTATLSTAETLVAGDFAITVRVVDANRQPVVRTFPVRVIALPVSVEGTLDPFVVGAAVSDVLTISGGTGTYASVTTQSGALPAGVSVSLVGDELQFSGTPTTAGAWSVVLRVTDTDGAFADEALSGTVTVSFASVLDDDPNYKANRALLHFNGTNGSTLIVDRIGSEWTAYGNAQITTTTTKFGGGCLLLDGTGDYVGASIPDCIGTGDFRVRCWIRLDSLDADAEIFCISSDSFNTSQFNLVFEVKTTGAVRGSIQDATGGTNVDITTSTGLIATGTWYYVEFNAVGTTARVFVDGVVQASGTITGTRNNTQSNCRIGFLSNDFGGIVTRYLHGRVDDFNVKQETGPTSTYTPPAAELPSIPVPVFDSVWDADEYNAAQAVVTDGTHVWFTTGKLIYKYTVAGTYVSVKDTAADAPTAKEQVNGMCIKDGKLYVSAALYASGEGSSWIVEYDLATLDYITHRQLVGDWFSECVDYAHGSWWVIFHANMVAAQYDDDWNLVDTHDLTFTVTGSSGGYGPGTGYESGKWRGNYLFCNVHEIYNENFLDVYAWNGTAFEEVCRWPHRRLRATQGLCFDPTDPDVMFFAEREYVTPPDRVARMVLL